MALRNTSSNCESLPKEFINVFGYYKKLKFSFMFPKSSLQYLEVENKNAIN